MSTIKVSNIQNASTSSGGIAIDTSGHVTVDGVAYPSAGSLSGRNRIINGDMRIDQRNAGAAVTIATASAFYAIDRWLVNKDTSGATATIQRSSVAPTGFTNSALITVSTGANATGSEQNIIQQSIEGFNVADLGWGTANAQSISLGFWVRSSVAGTYGISVSNSAANRAYLTTYTVNAANTFEYKAVTIPGDTTGTWLADNGIGIRVRWDFGSGPSRQGTANSWGTTLNNTTSAQANVIGTTGATFYITGVQLEAGTVATPFERRSYGQELSLCQRYFVSMDAKEVTLIGGGSTRANGTVFFPCAMRNSPTLTGVTSNRLTNYGILDYLGSYTFSAVNSVSTHATIAYTRSTGSTWSAGLPLAVSNSSGSVNISAAAEL